MKYIIIISTIIFLSACNTTYVKPTPQPQIIGEHLDFPLLDEWKILETYSSPELDTKSYIARYDSPIYWTGKIKVLTFDNTDKKYTAETLAVVLMDAIKGNCYGKQHDIFNGLQNNYATSAKLITCYNSIKKEETVVNLKTIEGTDKIYGIEMRFNGYQTDQELNDRALMLKNVIVVDGK